MSEIEPWVNIFNTSNELKSIIESIAKKKGIPVSDFVKPFLRRITEKHKELTKEPQRDKIVIKSIKVYGVSSKVAKDLDNISTNLNVPLNALLKIELNDFMKEYKDKY